MFVVFCWDVFFVFFRVCSLLRILSRFCSRLFSWVFNVGAFFKFFHCELQVFQFLDMFFEEGVFKNVWSGVMNLMDFMCFLISGGFRRFKVFLCCCFFGSSFSFLFSPFFLKVVFGFFIGFVFFSFLWGGG